MKKFISISFFTLLSMSLIACASEPESESQNQNSSDNESGQSADDESSSQHLTVDLAAAPVSLDPHAANDGNSLYVMTNIYDTLVYLDTDLNIQPGLAESFEPVEDTVWEAQIREGVTFHDGSELDAEVVKANLDRVRDPDLGSPLGFLFDMIEEVEVIDDYTVHITTEFPFSALPSHLAHPGGHIISLESINADYEAIENGEAAFASVNENPVGTGYYKFESQDPGESVTLVKNEDYWGEPANMDEITFKVVPEDLTRVGELETGDADIIYPVNANDISRIDSNDGTRVEQSDSANLTYLGMNTEVEPFDDVLVRQAISKAIDKESLINIVTDGAAIEADGPLAPTVFGYSENLEPYAHDVEEAQELLAEAGYEDGFSATILTSDNRAFIDIAETVQSQLGAIGIDLTIDTVETGTYLDISGSGDTELYVGSWGTVTLDADYGLYAMFHSSNAGAPGNRSFLDNEEVDDLLEQARQSTDEDERLELYEDVQQLLIDEAPMVYLYHSILLAGLSDDVDGFYQYPSSFPYLKEVTLDNE